MSAQYHPLGKRLLDGELSLAELPAELRAEGEQALRLIRGVDRAPVTLPATLDARVMATVRRHAASPVRRAWRRLTAPRDVELRLRVRPWTVWAGALAAAAAVVLLVRDRKSTRLNSSHGYISYAVFCLKKKKKKKTKPIYGSLSSNTITI